MSEDFFKKLIKMEEKHPLDRSGYTTVKTPRGVVIDLKLKGVNVNETVENFLKELLANLKKDPKERSN